MEALDIGTIEELKSYVGWVEESLIMREEERQLKWTKSIAVGSEVFVEKIRAELGIKAIGREITGKEGNYEMRE
jgi:hypothetical protein